MHAGRLAGRTLLVLGSLLLVAACSTSGGTGSPGSSSSQAAAASGPPRYGDPYAGMDPNAPACKLLTQAEVEAALTQTQNTPVGTTTPKSECHYVNAAGFGLTVELIHSTNAIADLATRKKDYGSHATDLAGVGEAAYQTTGQRVIEFVVKDTIVNLYTEERTDVLTPDEFVGLAKLAAGRVPAAVGS